MPVPDDAFHVYDTTLRDGMQQRGLSLTVPDKLAVARHLDALGVGFIEGGWPGAVPRDTEFFRRARDELRLRHARLAAFGATRRPGVRTDRDPQIRALLDSGAEVVTLVAKSHHRHVELALRTTLEENLAMVRDSVRFLVGEGRRVFLDAEHFFDGYRSNRRYALDVLRTAADAGADVVVLCDTNGGMLPRELGEVVAETVTSTGVRVGVHCHDDTGCAVANSLIAIDAGASHVQGTANGYGERSGNANLFSIVADLALKMDRPVVPADALAELTGIARAIAGVTGVVLEPRQPYVGDSAFAHKAGLHASAISIDPGLYQHIEPARVGNGMHVVVSDLAGRAAVRLKGAELGYDLSAAADVVGRVVDRVKVLEGQGYLFDAAEASFELLLREELGAGTPAEGRRFEVESWRVTVERLGGRAPVCEATVKLEAKGERLVSTAEETNPVEALDRALRVGLERFFPELALVSTLGHSVHVLPPASGGRAVTRVLLESGDGARTWRTVGVGADTVAASWEAVHQSVAYALLGDEPDVVRTRLQGNHLSHAAHRG